MLSKDKKAILKQRASEIAKPLITEQTDDILEVLVFNISNESYAIETSFIEEVYSVKNITEIPFVPAFIKGVVNIRGYIYSVVDLALVFNLEKQTELPNPKIIIIKNKEMEFGILTYLLEGVEKISINKIQASPMATSLENSDYISGVTLNNIIVLNTENILSDQKMKIHQEI